MCNDEETCKEAHAHCDLGRSGAMKGGLEGRNWDGDQ